MSISITAQMIPDGMIFIVTLRLKRCLLGLADALTERGIVTPSPIQELVMPKLSKGSARCVRRAESCRWLKGKIFDRLICSAWK